MKRLAAKPLTSPVIPPPKEIKTSFLEKFLFNKTSRILLTLLIFLFFSLALKNNTKILLFFKDFLIFEINFFGTFLSTTIKHLSKSIEFDLKIFDMLEVKFDPIIIGYFSVLVTIFNLVCFINFYNFIYYFTFSKIITLYLI